MIRGTSIRIQKIIMVSMPTNGEKSNALPHSFNIYIYIYIFSVSHRFKKKKKDLRFSQHYPKSNINLKACILLLFLSEKLITKKSSQ